MLYILLIFAVIFIIVLAFSSNERETRVRTITPDGRERIEIHQSVSPSAGQTAARAVVGFVIWCVILVGALALYFSF